MERYEFSWTENGQMNAFGLHGTSQEVVDAICGGLQSVSTVTDVLVKHIVETVEDVTRTPA